MKSTTSSQKRTDKTFSKEITSADLFYQLVHMAATSAAGVSRDKVFELAIRVDSPSAQFFEEVRDIAENLRINYPDACRLVADRVKKEEARSFLYRLSDALRSGEPLDAFLAREAEIQGNNYENEYVNQLESLKKWNDGYVSVTISAGLIVIINMVSTMIYPVGMAMMMGMTFTAVTVTFLLAWIISRAAPLEIKNVALAEGSETQQRILKLVKILVPAALGLTVALGLLGLDRGWIMIVGGIVVLPVGIVVMRSDGETTKKDEEVGAFLRSIGGQASSRGTTLRAALTQVRVDSFPALQDDIIRLGQRLEAFVKPPICWRMFAVQSGSKLIKDTVGIFNDALELGGDPEKSGILTSLFATRTSLLRAKRMGVAATFSWLVVVMHVVVVGLLAFILEILDQFTVVMTDALTIESSQTTAAMGTDMMSYMIPDTSMLDEISFFLVLMLILTNGYAVVASEGSHLLKILFWGSIMLVVSGMVYLVVPSVVGSLLSGL